MGREIRRVPLGFDWPLDETWHGFINPHYSAIVGCEHCHGSGGSPYIRDLTNLWNYGNTDGLTFPGWQDDALRCHLTQEEVDHIVDEGGLMDLAWQWSREGGWQQLEAPDGGPYYPPADEVNRHMRTSFGGGGDRWIWKKYRAALAGEPMLCAACAGEGSYFPTRREQKICEAWEETPVPEGPAWQVWQTVGEGAPVSPAFATAEELVDYLVEGGDLWDRKRGRPGYVRETAEAFVRSGWVPSVASSGGEVFLAIECARK